MNDWKRRWGLNVWIEVSRWCGAVLVALFGLVACAESGNSQAVGAEARQALEQHVQSALDSLEKDKLKDLGLAPPYDLAKKDFEKAYGVQVVSMKWDETGGRRGIGSQPPSAAPPRGPPPHPAGTGRRCTARNAASDASDARSNAPASTNGAPAAPVASRARPAGGGAAAMPT